jgi:hypothetical protein
MRKPLQLANRVLTVTTLLAATVVGIVAVPLAAPASAQAPPCQEHPYGHDFDGYYTSATTNYAGSYGYLTTQQALLCTSDTGQDNFSTAWVMVANSPGQNFGQVGYFETYGRGTHWFTAYQSDAQGYAYYEWDDWTDTIGAGSTYQYATTKAENNVPACPGTINHSCLTSLINGQLFGYSSMFPWNAGQLGAFPQPDYGEFYGEVKYFTSDVPGTYAHAEFANLAWMSGSYVRSSNFAPNVLHPNDTDTYWFRETTLGTGPTFYIWDGLS